MTRLLKLTGSTAGLALSLAGPLQADVTAQQVWDDLSGYMQGFGYAVTATQTPNGDGLTVSDVTMSMDMPDESGTFAFSMSEVTLANQGDGTVQVTFPTSMPITFSVREEEDIDVRIDYEHEGLNMIVSGDPDDLVYDYTADTLKLTLAELVVDGETIPREGARAVISMSDAKGRSTSSIGDLREMEQTMSVTGASYDVAFSDPDGETSGFFKGSMANLTFEGTSALPLEFDANDMASMMAAGMSGDGEFRYENGQTEFAATEEGNTTTGTFSSASAVLGVGLSENSLSYDLGNTDLSVSITSPDMPFPIDAKMERTAFNLMIPVTASEEPQDMALGLTLGGFTMSEMLWSIFDSGAQLPRDPATVSANLTGQVTPFVDFFDAEQMAELESSGAVPGELNALNLTDLEVSAAGARLTGEGSFTFDNSDLETFDGMPKPTGSVDLQLTGANALIDRLIAMGLLAEEDAMGARMMMSMFTVPAGDDELNSTIEVNEQGHVLANGQRIR
ncbi:DUF2125 domain-containing protein [Thalassococcus sp. BH17M4-6]|uniref:DUF2125 domain-containing protein n=1 Tax=Thalassococcus sp. BH17M4-6 TaxID=3413148 RepID=UPI003BBC0735